MAPCSSARGPPASCGHRSRARAGTLPAPATGPPGGPPAAPAIVPGALPRGASPAAHADRRPQRGPARDQATRRPGGADRRSSGSQVRTARGNGCTLPAAGIPGPAPRSASTLPRYHSSRADRPPRPPDGTRPGRVYRRGGVGSTRRRPSRPPPAAPNPPRAASVTAGRCDGRCGTRTAGPVHRSLARPAKAAGPGRACTDRPGAPPGRRRHRSPPSACCLLGRTRGTDERGEDPTHTVPIPPCDHARRRRLCCRRTPLSPEPAPPSRRPT